MEDQMGLRRTEVERCKVDIGTDEEDGVLKKMNLGEILPGTSEERVVLKNDKDYPSSDKQSDSSGALILVEAEGKENSVVDQPDLEGLGDLGAQLEMERVNEIYVDPVMKEVVEYVRGIHLGGEQSETARSKTLDICEGINIKMASREGSGVRADLESNVIWAKAGLKLDCNLV
jgi:hypothetical protein